MGKIPCRFSELSLTLIGFLLSYDKSTYRLLSVVFAVTINWFQCFVLFGP